MDEEKDSEIKTQRQINIERHRLEVKSYNAKRLARYGEELARYKDLWTTAHLFLFLGRKDDKWLILACRITFSDTPTTTVLELYPTPTSLILSKDFSVAAGEEFLRALVEFGKIGAITTDGSLTAELDWPDQQWGDPHSCQAVTARSSYDLDRPIWIFERNSGRLGEQLGDDFFKAINRRLPLSSPSFANIDTLLKRLMPGVQNITEQSNQIVQFIGTLPFDLAYDNGEQTLVLTAPPAAFRHDVRLITHFTDGSSQTFRAQQDIGPWQTPITWPVGVQRASAQLYYDEEPIGTFEFQRWQDTINVAVRANTYFDENHAMLRSRLLGKDAPDFERAVVELLNLLGLPTVWYGNKKVQNRSDALAVFQEWNGKNVALLIECTLIKASAKFTPLLKRAKDLYGHINGEAEVVPIVFVGAPASVADMEHAKIDGILLADAILIEQLLYLLAIEPKAWDVMQLLRTYRIPYSSPSNLVRW